jgi:hypothetical protein
VVGSHYAKIGSNIDQGAAYVFIKPAGGWSGDVTQSAKLGATDGAALDTFGEAVAIDANTIAVGADNAKVVANSHQGAVYVFEMPNGGWSGNLTQNAKLTASDGLANDCLGLPVSVSGGAVAAGARFAKIGANLNQGSAYVFVRPGAGWSGDLSQSAKLTASDGAANDDFGSGVAISGNTVVVGAPGGTVNHNASQGSAYVYVMPGAGWTGSLNENAKLTATDGGANYHFGDAVSANGSVILVGANLTRIGVNGAQGSAYLFNQPMGGWTGSLTQTTELTASDGAAGDTFGNAVSISGSSAVVGAYQAQIGVNAQQGAAYLYPTGPTHVYLPIVVR